MHGPVSGQIDLGKVDVPAPTLHFQIGKVLGVLTCLFKAPGFLKLCHARGNPALLRLRVIACRRVEASHFSIVLRILPREIEPGRRFLYELSRPNGRLFQVEFDLSRPVPLPPWSSWGAACPVCRAWR